MAVLWIISHFSGFFFFASNVQAVDDNEPSVMLRRNLEDEMLAIDGHEWAASRDHTYLSQALPVM